MYRIHRWLKHSIRFVTLGVCVLAVGVSISRAQVRPPLPPGGIGGGPIIPPPPIGMIGGGPVIPPPPVGMIGGAPVIPPAPPIATPPTMPTPGVAGGAPGFPNPPTMPNPGMNGGGPGFPNPPGINRPGGLMRWSCTKCGAFLADSVNEPIHIRNCPRCGVHFIDGAGGGGPVMNFNPPPPPVAAAPNAPLVVPGNIAAPGNIEPGMRDEARAASRSFLAVMLIVGLGIAGLVVIGGGAVLAIFLLMKSGSPSGDMPRRRSRR